MPCVVVDDWVPGLNVIRLIKLLRASTGLGLCDAKTTVDAFVEQRRPIHVPFMDAAGAESFARAVAELGTRARVLDHDCR